MQETKRTSINWGQLTQRIIDAPELIHAPESILAAELGNSVLFDGRLESLLNKYADVFECVVISHMPLTMQGADIQLENNESRCWVRGSADFENHPLVTQDDMRKFLEGWVSLLREIHARSESLFLHPYLFDDDKFKGYSAPPVGKATITSKYNIKIYPQDQMDVTEPVAIQADKGYHYSPKISIYNQADLKKNWDKIYKRTCDQGISSQKDAEICLRKQVGMCHDFICTWLYKGDPIARATTLYACPTSVLTHHQRSSHPYEIASGIVGIFWLNFVANGQKWGRKEKSAAEEILRTTWFLVLSDHLYRKQEADERKGRAEGMLAAAHDMSRVVLAIKPQNPPIVIDLIRSYFGLVVGHLIEHGRDTTGTSSELYKYNLQELFNEQASRAGKIEAMVKLVKEKSNIEEPEALAQIDQVEAWIKTKLGTFEPLRDSVIRLTTSEAEAFRLAVTEALRNTFRHTLKSEEAVKNNESTKGYVDEISIQVKLSPEQDRLVIENVILQRFSSLLTEGRVTGTVAALKIYAKSYNGNPELVKVEQLSCEPFRISTAKFKEEWRTILPLPIQREVTHG